MSMMDTMNAGAQSQPAAAQPADVPAAQGQPQDAVPGSYARMGEDGQLQQLTDKVMMLISKSLWSEGKADQVAAQLGQPGAQPEEVVGKFTGFMLMMANSAAKESQRMLPPIVMIGCAAQTAAQLTDIALAMKLITPDEADDVAEAGALIGVETFAKNTKGNGMQADERQEYSDIMQQLISQSPGNNPVSAGQPDENNEGDPRGGDGVTEAQMQQPQQGGM